MQITTSGTILTFTFTADEFNNVITPFLISKNMTLPVPTNAVPPSVDMWVHIAALLVAADLQSQGKYPSTDSPTAAEALGIPQSAEVAPEYPA